MRAKSRLAEASARGLTSKTLVTLWIVRASMVSMRRKLKRVAKGANGFARLREFS